MSITFYELACIEGNAYGYFITLRINAYDKQTTKIYCSLRKCHLKLATGTKALSFALMQLLVLLLISHVDYSKDHIKTNLFIKVDITMNQYLYQYYHKTL